MRSGLAELLVCPACGASAWSSRAFASAGERILEGTIECGQCRTWYRIENGIVDLLPLALRRHDLHAPFARKHALPFAAASSEGDSEKRHQMEFYAGNVDEYEENLVNTGFWKALDEITFVQWMRRELKPGQAALEVGCGSGRICVRLAQHGVRTVGVDISEEMLRRAQAKVEDGGHEELVDLIVGDGENPPVRDERFDACVLHGILHHVPHPAAAVASSARKLRGGGHLYTFDPHKSPARPLFDAMMKVWKLYDEEARAEPLFSEKQLRGWLESAGLAADIRLTTYLPPHALYFFGEQTNRRLLSFSDALFSRIPGVRKLGGVIVAEGRKRP